VTPGRWVRHTWAPKMATYGAHHKYKTNKYTKKIEQETQQN
jgi:hypothetical protein